MSPAILPREVTATLVFSAAGVASVLFVPGPWPLKAPNALFYAVLVLNTYFSVRFFDALPPENRDERVIDGVLALLYVGLAAAIGAPVIFALVSTLLFLAAVAKYWLLLPVMARRALLMRKMAIDACGAVLCVASLAGSFLTDALASAWLQAIVFAVANVYLLAVRPMYVDREAPVRPM